MFNLKKYAFKDSEIQQFPALFSYFFFSLCIFTSIFSRSFSGVFSASAFLWGLILIIIFRYFANSSYFASQKSKLILSPFYIISYLLCCLCLVLCLTEVIRDVSYITNNTVSLKYYLLLATALLCICLYTFTKFNGIFRFCIICSSICIICFLLLCCSFFTPFSFNGFVFCPIANSVPSDILYGIICAFFICGDLPLFLFCFKNQLCTDNKKVKITQLLLPYILSFMLMFICFLLCGSIFGTEITHGLENPFYAMTKLIPLFDCTELISVMRIFGFTIKFGIYLGAMYKLCRFTLFGGSKNKRWFISGFYFSSLIIAFIMYLATKENPRFGAFQRYGVISLICFFIVFSVCLLIISKKNYTNHASTK